VFGPVIIFDVNILEKKEYFVTIPLFLWKEISQKIEELFQKIATIAYNMKGCFRFSTFMFSLSKHLAKYTY
jgi:hypothetical protein